MLVPVIMPGIEQRMHLSRDGIDPRQIWALVHIARETGEGKILLLRLSAVLLGNDMVNLEWDSVARLRHQAILAPIPRPAEDSSHQSGIHRDLYELRPRPLREILALACRNASR